tara:strand:- start:45 stop:794 length:750 start_codon:yes stop_codon:yes gene_type:complete
MRDHLYRWSKVVIGNSYRAIKYSFDNNCVILCTDNVAIFPFDTIDKTNKEKSACELLFELSLNGLAPLSDKIETIRLKADNLLHIVTSNARLVKASFEELVIFDCSNVNGIPSMEEENIIGFRVFDWFDVNSGATHEHNIIIDEASSGLVNKIYFYESTRTGSGRKDLVSESFLTREQLNDFEYSDTISRLKTLHMMREKGIKGSKNGKTSTALKHRPLAINLRKRQVHAQYEPFYKKVGNIIFDLREE